MLQLEIAEIKQKAAVSEQSIYSTKLESKMWKDRALQSEAKLRTMQEQYVQAIKEIEQQSLLNDKLRQTVNLLDQRYKESEEMRTIFS